MAGHSNGITPKKGLTSSNKKRRNNHSSVEDEDNAFRVHVTEDRYRAMLGEHMLKYKRRGKNSSASPASIPIVAPGPKIGSKGWKMGTDPRAYDVDTKPDYEDNNSPLNLGIYHEEEFVPKYGIRRPLTEPAYLDIRDGITYMIPPTYEKLVPSLNLPGMPDILVEEVYLEGTLDLGSLAMMMENDKRFGPGSRTGMGETRAQYELLQSRLKALPNSSEKFDLKVSDVALNSFAIPEGAAGGIRRSILSDSGLLQVYYVKVLEKGDTYEIIERSLPKKQKVVKDPLMIENEEMEK